jgi:hypothetical protein
VEGGHFARRLAVITEAVSTSETWISLYDDTRCNILEDDHLLLLEVLDPSVCRSISYSGDTAFQTLPEERINRLRILLVILSYYQEMLEE